jgi:hypothetical protein
MPPPSFSGYPINEEQKEKQMSRKIDHAKHPPGPLSSYRYAIRVEGHLDAHWSEWLAGMTITHEEDGITLLEGALIDQSALLGLLGKLADLHLTMLSLQRREPALPRTCPAAKSGLPAGQPRDPRLEFEEV